VCYPPSEGLIWQMRTVRRTWHVVTTLLHTDDVIKAGGFDETLIGQEDKDFYLKLLTHRCICPIRLNKPLVFYHNSGNDSRSSSLDIDNQRQKLAQLMSERYGHKMACCGQISRSTFAEIGAKLEGDYLVTPTWGGNRNYFGMITGRKYGRLSRGKSFWCDPKDAKADKKLQILSEDISIIPLTETDDYGVEIIEGTLSPLQKMAMAYGEDVSAVPMADVPIEPSGKKTVRGRKSKTTLPSASDDASQFTKTT
jgi:hypothetical protein